MRQKKEKTFNVGDLVIDRLGPSGSMLPGREEYALIISVTKVYGDIEVKLFSNGSTRRYTQLEASVFLTCC